MDFGNLGFRVHHGSTAGILEGLPAILGTDHFIQSLNLLVVRARRFNNRKIQFRRQRQALIVAKPAFQGQASF